MNVAAILKDKGTDITTTHPEARLIDIVSLLERKRIGSVLVVDDNGKLVGIISERDVIKRIARDGTAILQKPIEICMTCDVQTCSREDSLDELMNRMTENRFRHLPVVEDGLLVGLVSIGDVVKLKMAETEMEATALKQYIATG